MAKIEPSGNANRERGLSKAVDAIVADRLACQRGGRIVVSGLSFEVRSGNALALRGPNGSGKTTLLRTIAGFLAAAAGTVRIVREASRPPHSVSRRQSRPGDIASRSARIRERMRLGGEDDAATAATPSPQWERAGVRGDSDSSGQDDRICHYIGHTNGIKPRLTVIENVSFWQRYYGGGEDIETAEAALEAFALLSLASFNAGHLSQGQARRLGLARLLAAHRPIWLLDEPSVSLDAASTKLLEGAIAHHLATGGIALIATHLDLALSKAAFLELGAAPVPQ